MNTEAQSEKPEQRRTKRERYVGEALNAVQKWRDLFENDYYDEVGNYLKPEYQQIFQNQISPLNKSNSETLNQFSPKSYFKIYFFDWDLIEFIYLLYAVQIIQNIFSLKTRDFSRSYKLVSSLNHLIVQTNNFWFNKERLTLKLNKLFKNQTLIYHHQRKKGLLLLQQYYENEQEYIKYLQFEEDQKYCSKYYYYEDNDEYFRRDEFNIPALPD